MASPKTATKGLGDLADSIGANFDEIEGKPVTVTAIAVSKRQLDGDEKEIAVITLDNGARYHAWSPSLAEKLAAIDPSDLPAVGVFRKAKTRAGFEVWTVDNA